MVSARAYRAKGQAAGFHPLERLQCLSSACHLCSGSQMLCHRGCSWCISMPKSYKSDTASLKEVVVVDRQTANKDKYSSSSDDSDRPDVAALLNRGPNQQTGWFKRHGHSRSRSGASYTGSDVDPDSVALAEPAQPPQTAGTSPGVQWPRLMACSCLTADGWLALLSLAADCRFPTVVAYKVCMLGSHARKSGFVQYVDCMCRHG